MTVNPPPLLTDGKHPPFEEWKLGIERKLKAHEDHQCHDFDNIGIVCSHVTNERIKLGWDPCAYSCA
jgi:hypothetical protein